MYRELLPNGSTDLRLRISGMGGRRSETMIVTTTPSIEKREIQQYLGIVTGEAILGANIFRDLFAGVRRGGRGSGL